MKGGSDPPNKNRFKDLSPDASLNRNIKSKRKCTDDIFPSLPTIATNDDNIPRYVVTYIRFRKSWR